MMETTPECDQCHIPMESHMIAIHQLGAFYPGYKCSKCGRVVMHSETGQKIGDDCWKKRGVRWNEHDRIMRRVLITEGVIEPDDNRSGEELAKVDQYLSFHVRNATKYPIKSDTQCPRCGKKNIAVRKERACGIILTCQESGCHHCWFYEYP